MILRWRWSCAPILMGARSCLSKQRGANELKSGEGGQALSSFWPAPRLPNPFDVLYPQIMSQRYMQIGEQYQFSQSQEQSQGNEWE